MGIYLRSRGETGDVQAAWLVSKLRFMINGDKGGGCRSYGHGVDLDEANAKSTLHDV